MIRFNYGKIPLRLDHLLAMKAVWPHPLARVFFRTEVHLLRAIENKLMENLGAYEDTCVKEASAGTRRTPV